MKLPGCSVVAFAVLLVASGLCEAWPEKKTVKVTNDLPNFPGGSLLFAHCRSRDNSLGVHILKRHESFEFSFKTSFLRDTRFQCDFYFDGRKRFLTIFKEGNTDLTGCRFCEWYVGEFKACRLPGGKGHCWDLVIPKSG